MKYSLIAHYTYHIRFYLYLSSIPYCMRHYSSISKQDTHRITKKTYTVIIKLSN